MELVFGFDEYKIEKKNPWIFFSGGQSPLGNMDLSGLLGNPALMNMATTMLSDPNMQNMMGQLMGGGGGGMGGGPGGAGNIDNLLQA